MGNYTGGVNTICPYYSHESDKTITCEGMIDETYVMSRFVDSEAKTNWQCQVCATFKYNVCPIANINDKKFDIEGIDMIIPKKKLIKKQDVKFIKPIKVIRDLPGQISFDDYIKNGGSL